MWVITLFVCELASKGSVVDYLKACERKYHTPWKYLHHATLGLAYLHGRGLILGDFTRGNILIGDDGQAKLANFDSSTSLRSSRKEEERSLVNATAGT